MGKRLFDDLCLEGGKRDRYRSDIERLVQSLKRQGSSALAQNVSDARALSEPGNSAAGLNEVALCRLVHEFLHDIIGNAHASGDVVD